MKKKRIDGKLITILIINNYFYKESFKVIYFFDPEFLVF